MTSITGVLTLGGLVWQIWPGPLPGDDDAVGVRLTFRISGGASKVRRREALKAVQDRTEQLPINWLIPGKKEWMVDCEGLKESFEALKDQDWLMGKIHIEPEWEEEQREVFDNISYEGYFDFELTPNIIKEARLIARGKACPPEISESLERFVRDYPDPLKVAFIMMRFGTTAAHNKIVAAVKSVLESRGIMGFRADDRQYHDDLFYNILTYMWGCGFGIAVFERLERDDFNPNVSLELGYMMAMLKPVCLLKDRTLPTLQSDLMGKLYKSFDPQDPEQTIKTELEKWLNDMEL